MANLPSINMSSLSAPSADDAAMNKQMRQNLLNKLRAPPLVHAWDFWHDRQDRTTASSPSPPEPQGKPKYEQRLVHLASITDIRAFWSVFNNFDIAALPLRDSIHLFHAHVKPLWEDPRNIHGGCWTFRIPREKAPLFWQQVCLLAIGERLQAAVDEPDRVQFRDDICGVSLSVRFTSILVSVWNRDKGHEEGIRRILETVLQGVTEEARPREGAYYYKAHSEHAAFGGSGKGQEERPSSSRPATAESS